jgi:hypothetical protein
MLAGADLDEGMKNLLGGITVSVVPSYFQNLKSSNLISAQLASNICFDGQCATDEALTVPLNNEDLSGITQNDDLGILIHESFLQNFIQSAAFENRIAKYYQTTPSAGTVLSPLGGVRVFLDPKSNSIQAILNLEVDIKSTTTPGMALRERLRRKIGDVLESAIGSGQTVKAPVPVNLKIVGIQKDEKGVPNLVLQSSLPAFGPNHTFTPSDNCSIFICPNNIPAMVNTVRNEFLDVLQDQVKQIIPSEIRIPLGSSNSFNLHDVHITKNHALLITGAIAPQGLQKTGVK